MKRRISLGFCFVIFAGAVYAATLPPICGEWTGSRPPKGTTRPNEQKWILTFRPDNSFLLGFVEGTTPVPGIEGSYKATSSNIVLQLPNAYPVTMAYSIQEKDLKIELSKLTTMLGSGDGVEKYVRTKEVTELATQQKQKLLKEGRYKLTVTLAKDNEDTVLKNIFGDQYKTSFSKPIDGGTFPLHQLQSRNIIQLPGEQFGPPEFNGEAFKVYGAVAPKVIGEFSGKIISSTKIEGTFKSRSTSLHGTFTMERVKPVAGEPPEASKSIPPPTAYYGEWRMTFEGISGMFKFEKGDVLVMTGPNGVHTSSWHYLKSGRIEVLGRGDRTEGYLSPEKKLILLPPQNANGPAITLERMGK